jgi:hypothetical protein
VAAAPTPVEPKAVATVPKLSQVVKVAPAPISIPKPVVRPIVKPVVAVQKAAPYPVVKKQALAQAQVATAASTTTDDVDPNTMPIEQLKAYIAKAQENLKVKEDAEKAAKEQKE